MNVLLVSASPLVHCLLGKLLSHTLDIRVIPCRCDPVAIRAAILQVNPVMILMDESLSMDLQACKVAIQRKNGPAIQLILLASDAPERASRGWAGVTRLQVESPNLLAELVIAVRQRIKLQPGALASLDPVRLSSLAPRERAVLERLAKGCSSLEVATDLGVTRQTVETYRRNLCYKLGVSGSRLVRAAVLSGLLTSAERMT